MRRYIDVDKLKDMIQARADMLINGKEAFLYVAKWLDLLPTKDVVEVRHGEWIEKDDGWDGVIYTCSVCDCDWTTIDGTPFENNMRYCPECGAKMDGERKDKQ